MKKALLILPLILVGLVGCSNDNPGPQSGVYYKVVFNPNNTKSSFTQSVEENQKVIKPSDPIKEGYTFLRWVDSSSNNEWMFEENAVTCDLTLDAVYQVNQYTVTFEDGFGNIVSTITDDYGTKIVPLADLTNDNHEFVKWDIPKLGIIPAANITIKPVWKSSYFESKENVLTKYAGNPINLDIPDFITTIGEGAFENCVSLESIHLPNSITSIENDAFYNCRSLESVNIPDSVTSIGDRAFYGLNLLKTIVVPESVTRLGANVFYGPMLRLYIVGRADTSNWNRNWNPMNIPCCTGVEDGGLENEFAYFINGNVAYIEHYFGDEDNLIIPTTLGGHSVKCITFSAFEGCNFKTVVVPEGVTEILSDAFEDCASLTYISLPDTVKDIESGVFSGCSSLSEIKLPKNLREIGNASFMGCSSLTTISIPRSVNTIGQYAFEHCVSLENIYISSNVSFVGTYAFYDCNKLQIECEVSEMPSSWNRDWNPSNCNVTWNVRK